jgi:hypothetical protein
MVLKFEQWYSGLLFRVEDGTAVRDINDKFSKISCL